MSNVVEKAPVEPIDGLLRGRHRASPRRSLPAGLAMPLASVPENVALEVP